MGKKGFILDNGKKAQSSMALYWQKDKMKSKQPKQKLTQQNQNEITDKSVMSNYQKWKMHKQKVISKAYTKPQKSQQQQTQKQKKKQQDDQELMQRLMQNKKPKVINHIPGFNSKNSLTNKLQIQKPKQADQSTNILRLPGHMQTLTQQQIVQMLRQRKSKQQMQKRRQNNQNKEHKHAEKQDMMLGDEYIDLIKKKQKEIDQQKQKQAIIEQKKQPQPQPNYFKSNILNKMQKQGIQKVLFDSLKLQEVKVDEKHIQTVDQTLLSAQLKIQKSQNQLKNHFVNNPKFLPRVLKK